MYQESNFLTIHLLVKPGQPVIAQNLAQKEYFCNNLLHFVRKHREPCSSHVHKGISTDFTMVPSELKLQSAYIPLGWTVKDSLGLLLWWIRSDSGLMLLLLDTAHPGNKNKLFRENLFDVEIKLTNYRNFLELIVRRSKTSNGLRSEILLFLPPCTLER